MPQLVMSRLGTLKAMMTLQFVGSALPCKICINFPTLMTTLIYTFFHFSKASKYDFLISLANFSFFFFSHFSYTPKMFTHLAKEKGKERKGNKPKNHY